MEIVLLFILFLIVFILFWALSGEKGDVPVIEEKPEKPGEDSPDKIFRRRAADKEIEEESKYHRRKTDEPLPPESHEIDDSFDLPYLTDEVFSPSSRSRVYRRTLMNAEIYARKGDFTTAISLYEGVRSRIGDAEALYKIESDIDYLKNYKAKVKSASPSSHGIQQKRTGGNEVKFNIDGEVPQVINIGIQDREKALSPEKIAEIVSDQLKKEISSLKKPQEEENDDLRLLQEELRTLKGDISSLNTDREKAIKELEEHKKEQETRKKSEIDLLQDEIQGMKKNLENIDSEREKALHELEKIKGEKETNKNDDMSRLMNELSGMRENLDSLNSERDRAIRELEDLKKENLAKTQKEEEMKTLLGQIDKLKGNIDSLEEDRNKTTRELEELRKEREEKNRREIEELRDELKNISGLRDEINRMSERINDSLLRIPEASQRPDITEARFTLDPGPILDLLGKVPGKEVPEPTEILPPEQPEIIEDILPAESEEMLQELPGDSTSHSEPEPEKAEAEPGMPSSPHQEKEIDSEQAISDEQSEDNKLQAEPVMGENIPSEETTRSETVSIRQEITSEDVEEDDFELLKEYGKETTQFDEMSDEEIFEKILKDDRTPVTEDTSFEIIGDRRDDNEVYDIIDKEQERKRKEEEDFYRKFLKSDKMMKRELPILKVTYDFTKLPEEMSLSREKNIMEYSFYKFKPMLEKADEYIKRRKVRDAINYYKVVMAQNIPPEFKAMLRKNINDLTDYLERYLTAD